MQECQECCEHRFITQPHIKYIICFGMHITFLFSSGIFGFSNRINQQTQQPGLTDTIRLPRICFQLSVHPICCQFSFLFFPSLQAISMDLLPFTTRHIYGSSFLGEPCNTSRGSSARLQY